MPVVWLDPFMHLNSAYWGDGTTSNTIRDGSYASPYNFHDFYGNSTGTATVNGSTLAADTEVKIKGKSLSDLTNALGAVYANGIRMYAATGNTEWAANAESNGGAFLMPFNDSGNNVSKLLPTNYTPAGDFVVMWNYTSYTISSTSLNSNNVRMDNNVTEGLCLAIDDAGYDASSPFSNTSYQIKNAYLTSDSAWSNGDKYYMFNCTNLIKVSAGWVSETETSASGYTYYRMYQSDTYENIYLRGTTSTQLDFSRFIWEGARREYMWFRPAGQGTTGSPMVHSAPMAMKGYYWYGYERLGAFFSNQIIKCTNWANFQTYAANGGIVEIPLCSRHPLIYFNDSNANSRIKIGSVFADERNANADGFFLNSSNDESRAGTLETMDGATYYDRTTASSTFTFKLGHTSNKIGNVLFSVVGTPYRAGDTGGFLENAGSTQQTYNPIVGVGGNFCSTDVIYSYDIDLYKANWWEATGFIDNRVAGTHMPVKVMGVLQCNGVNPRGAANSITFVNNQTESQGFYKSLLAFETNDYDQKPITLVPSSAGDCTYAYNETISSENVLHFQGSATGSNIHRYPLELAVPSHTAGTDNLRIKLRLSKANYTDSVSVGYYYRKPDNDGGVYSAGTSVQNSGISSDSSSPSTHTLTFSLSANGTREINSLYITLGFKNQSTSAILRVHSAEVETY